MCTFEDVEGWSGLKQECSRNVKIDDLGVDQYFAEILRDVSGRTA